MRWIIMLVMLVFFCSACGISKKVVDNELSQLEKDFVQAEEFRGIHDVKMPSKIKLNSNLRLITPAKIEEGKAHPLVVALHWSGGGEVNKEFSSCLIEPALKSLNAYIIVPDAQDQIWITEENEKKVMELVRLAKKHWNIDSKKIMITGYSDGGNGTWFFAEKHPNIFRAAIPIASYYLSDQEVRTPIYFIHGKKDELFLLDDVLPFLYQYKKRGTDVTMKINDNLGHYEACSYVEDLKETIPWIKKKLKIKP